MNWKPYIEGLLLILLLWINHLGHAQEENASPVDPARDFIESALGQKSSEDGSESEESKSMSVQDEAALGDALEEFLKNKNGDPDVGEAIKKLEEKIKEKEDGRIHIGENTDLELGSDGKIIVRRPKHSVFAWFEDPCFLCFYMPQNLQNLDESGKAARDIVVTDSSGLSIPVKFSNIVEKEGKACVEIPGCEKIKTDVSLGGKPTVSVYVNGKDDTHTVLENLPIKKTDENHDGVTDNVPMPGSASPIGVCYDEFICIKTPVGELGELQITITGPPPDNFSTTFPLVGEEGAFRRVEDLQAELDKGYSTICFRPPGFATMSNIQSAYATDPHGVHYTIGKKDGTTDSGEVERFSVEISCVRNVLIGYDPKPIPPTGAGVDAASDAEEGEIEQVSERGTYRVFQDGKWGPEIGGNEPEEESVEFLEDGSCMIYRNHVWVPCPTAKEDAPPAIPPVTDVIVDTDTITADDLDTIQDVSCEDLVDLLGTSGITEQTLIDAGCEVPKKKKRRPEQSTPPEKITVSLGCGSVDHQFIMKSGTTSNALAKFILYVNGSTNILNLNGIYAGGWRWSFNLSELNGYDLTKKGSNNITGFCCDHSPRPRPIPGTTVWATGERIRTMFNSTGDNKALDKYCK